MSDWKRKSAKARYGQLISSTVLFGIGAWIFGGTWMQTVCLVMAAAVALAIGNEIWRDSRRNNG
ncbi:hypothetical protein [Mesorhizobium sp. A623]